MVARKASASATGGRMLNPSVEPTARRESAQFRRDSQNGNPQHPTPRSSLDRGNGSDAGSGGSITTLPHASDSAAIVAAEDARNQRRSIGLKRLSVNDHMKESLVLAQEAMTQNVGTAIKTSGLEKLQDIMTEAKEKGLGVSKLFHFFLAQSELSDRRGSTRSILGLLEKSALVPEETADDEAGEGTGGVFKETHSSKTRAEASKSSRTSTSKKKSMELMPSLQKGKRPSTASTKRGSGSATGSARGPPASARENDPASRGGAGGSSGSGSRSSLARRSSSLEEAIVRDRQITPLSFQAGLTTLGFKMTDEETVELFDHLDDNKNGQIDLTEFTRFCLEIPSMAWKAERVRRGVSTSGTRAEADRGLDKAARDMANETVNGGDGADGGGGAGGAGNLETPVTLGKVVYKGDKFFWRTKELIEVVIQLNARVGFMAVSTFHTEILKAYPIIFVDPSKVPTNAAAVAALLEELRTKEMEAKKEAEMRRVGEADGPENAEMAAKKEEEERRAIEQRQSLSEQAQMAYIADYLLQRITMPDEDGNILQPDMTQPGVEVNPSLSSGDGGNQEGETRVSGSGGAVAARRPGLMRTTFDEWDTLLFPKPPARVTDRPKFGARKRDSYFEDFQNKKEEFDDNRVRAHRLSAEAAAYTEEVSNLMRKLAPLNYSASAPAMLSKEQLKAGAGDPLADVELNARPGSGRVVLADEISQAASAKRGSGAGNSLLESQSAPVLPAPESAAA